MFRVNGSCDVIDVAMQLYALSPIQYCCMLCMVEAGRIMQKKNKHKYLLAFTSYLNDNLFCVLQYIFESLVFFQL